MSQRHRFFLLLHMRKSFIYRRFPEMSILLKSRNHFNFSAPNKCGFLFKQIIFEYLFKQGESSVIKRPTSTTSGQTSTASGQTSTANGQTNGQTSTTSGKASTTNGQTSTTSG